jgi:hypothetical protein
VSLSVDGRRRSDQRRCDAEAGVRLIPAPSFWGAKRTRNLEIPRSMLRIAPE